VLKDAQEQAKAGGFSYTAVIMPGDLVRHGLSPTASFVPNPNWNLMLYTMQQVMSLVTEYLPGVPILPAIGNNDCYYHNDAPYANLSAQYYGDLWTVFFEEVPANQVFLQDPV
jgi:hypothetical protein